MNTIVMDKIKSDSKTQLFEEIISAENLKNSVENSSVVKMSKELLKQLLNYSDDSLIIVKSEIGIFKTIISIKKWVDYIDEI